MKKIKQLNNWDICELSKREQEQHGFKYAVIHPNTKETGWVTASDTDIECETLEQAIAWIENY